MSTRAQMLCAAAAAVMTVVATARAQPAASRAMLMRASRAVDVRAGAYRSDQGIWIEAGRIRQIGGFEEVRAAAPRDIVVVNLGPAAVLPGLIDCHTHLLDAMDPAGSPADNLILTLAKEGPARRALRGAKMAREMLEAGFTTVRNVGHSPQP